MCQVSKFQLIYFTDASCFLQHVTVNATQPNYILECGGVLIFRQDIPIVL
jgi:hypothetical protein